MSTLVRTGRSRRRPLLAFIVAVSFALPCFGKPLKLEATIPMPGVKGRIDHMAASARTHRLFVAALGNGTVEAIDTESRRRETIGGFGEPQGVSYVPATDTLIVANGGGDRVDILNAATGAVTRRIDGLHDADNVRLDARRGAAWVGYGRGALRVFDPADARTLGEVALPGHPESFQLERSGARAFVNVPTANAVVVVDQSSLTVIARWKVPNASANYPMAIDEAGGYVLVGARSPAVMLVFDARSGDVVQRVPICGDTDDMFHDGERKRVYLICGDGRVDVLRETARNRYALEASIATAPRARTGLFVPEDRRLYVAAPASATAPARLLVYEVE